MVQTSGDFVVDGGGSERRGERPVVKKKRLASAIAAIFYDEAGEEPLPGQWFQLDVEKAMERRRASDDDGRAFKYSHLSRAFSFILLLLARASLALRTKRFVIRFVHLAVQERLR